ncbi:MAG: sigma 54-interacting transcriptional regulator [Candidatus Omnitrophica bacterium]|nr:sigma 54-interacting transcriptional regulator [Candidatus Omnitrophota bacterium]
MEMNKNIKREIQELSLLFEISQTFNKGWGLEKALPPVLKIMAEHMGLQYGTLAILNRETNNISIELAYALSSEERARGIYKIGEGITGKVVESGQPIAVANVFDDPKFLNKTKARKNTNKEPISFICVPIKIEERVLGTLSADRLIDQNVSLKDDLRLLSIIALIIAQSVNAHQKLHEEEELLRSENERLQVELKQIHQPENMIGNSKAMREVYNLIEKVAKNDTTVFISGASGVGKELVASAIHYHSLRANKPFIKVNCAALPESLAESELFGHEKGAFTGALQARKGRFELADGGTLFLDEVADLPASAQVKLLRVLQENEFERVGGEKSIKIDVRIITATNRDIANMLKEETFREDLYFRLNVFPIHVPSLKARKTDIMLLADSFIDKFNKKLNKNIKRITTAAIDMMMSYHWPGNVRELENVMERAILMASDNVIHSYNLPASLQTAEQSNTLFKGTLQSILDSVEKDIIVDALKSAKGIGHQASIVLGLSDRILGLRLKKYKLNPRDYR